MNNEGDFLWATFRLRSPQACQSLIVFRVWWYMAELTPGGSRPLEKGGFAVLPLVKGLLRPCFGVDDSCFSSGGKWMIVAVPLSLCSRLYDP